MPLFSFVAQILIVPEHFTVINALILTMMPYPMRWENVKTFILN